MDTLESENLSLWALQDAMLRCEDEINSTQDLSLLIGQVAGKIDNIKQVIDILEADALRWDTYAKDMAAKKKSAEASAERLRNYVTMSLIAHDTSFELGNMWKVQLTSNEKVTLGNDPNIDDLLELGGLGIITTKYSWDKKAVKKLLESGNTDVMKVATIEKTNSVKFSANVKGKK
jgi:hypothetical protein